MARLILRLFAATLLVCSPTLAEPWNVRRAVTPVVASTTSYGSLDNQGLNRDSCSSSRWGSNVVILPPYRTWVESSNVLTSLQLWVCRDTQPITNGQAGFPGFGSLFYPLESDECPQFGACSDGTRWVGWPDTGPVVTFSGSNGVNAYAFIGKQHLSGLSRLNTPSYTLYHVISQGTGTTTIPSVSVDISSYWSTTQIGYGSAASVVNNGFAYLYGATPNGKLAVARAALTGFLGALEDRSIYEYYVNGVWTRTAPVSTDSTIPLANTNSAQGTIYWSPKWQSYVWIGGDGFPDANFLISTAPNPEGPWTAPTQFFSGAVGTGSLPAYSAVAHPSLTDGTGNYIFIGTYDAGKFHSNAFGILLQFPVIWGGWVSVRKRSCKCKANGPRTDTHTKAEGQVSKPIPAENTPEENRTRSDHGRPQHRCEEREDHHEQGEPPRAEEHARALLVRDLARAVEDARVRRRVRPRAELHHRFCVNRRLRATNALVGAKALQREAGEHHFQRREHHGGERERGEPRAERTQEWEAREGVEISEGKDGTDERLEDERGRDARRKVETQRLRALGGGEQDAQRRGRVEGRELVRGCDCTAGKENGPVGDNVHRDEEKDGDDGHCEADCCRSEAWLAELRGDYRKWCTPDVETGADGQGDVAKGHEHGDGRDHDGGNETRYESGHWARAAPALDAVDALQHPEIRRGVGTGTRSDSHSFFAIKVHSPSLWCVVCSVTDQGAHEGHEYKGEKHGGKSRNAERCL
ncbi:hypothetical protein FB451DRAFT_1493851 [Mycena latifolia]|nr:hypothetical protein FB451DRAFT_1493851 [Mycena latifolia]